MAWRGHRYAVLTVFLVGALVLSGVVAEDDEASITEESVDSEVEEEEEVEVVYATPKLIEGVHLMETFDDVPAFEKTWITSKAKKDGVDEDISKYDGVWVVEPAEKMALTGDKGLVLKSKAKHAAISVPLKKPFIFDKKPFVVQYEVNLQNGQECGGAYIKLLSADHGGVNLKQFNDKTPYTIMFGPDKCGNDFKLHFIFRHVNPITGEIEEKHAKRPRDKIEEPFKDKKPHLYTLITHPDNTFEILLDNEIINSGSLLEDFSPPVNPQKEIDDPKDSMPDDWDEREKIPDPDATKPDDWDEEAPFRITDPDAVKPAGWLDSEPEMIPDPSSVKPEDWDDEMDGEWEAPLINNPLCADVPGCGEWKPPVIDNPNYKGKWRPPMIENPNYRGKWTPRKIPNPDYFEDLEPFKMTSIGAVGLELWSMSDNILFDNLIVTDSISDAQQFAAETFDLKIMKLERGQLSFIQNLGKWMKKSTWFWQTYGLVCCSPIVVYFLYLTWWVRQPEPDEDQTTLWEKILKLTNYKPGAWLLYLAYLIIPTSIFVYCLAKRVYEVGVFRRIMNYSNKNPWLYGIYVLLVAIPVVLIFACCCAEAKDSKDKDAEHKKTDEPTEDDPHEEVAAAEKPESKANPESTEERAVESDAAAEEEEEEEEKEDEEDEGEDTADEEKAEKSGGDESPQPRTSPRLRKPRKE